MNLTKEYVEHAISELFAKDKATIDNVWANQSFKSFRSAVTQLDNMRDEKIVWPQTTDVIGTALTAIRSFVDQQVTQALQQVAPGGSAAAKALISSEGQAHFNAFMATLRAEADLISRAHTALRNDPAIATLNNSGWTWGNALWVKRLDVAFNAVVTPNANDQGQRLGGGQMAAPTLYDFGGNVGRRVFKRSLEIFIDRDLNLYLEPYNVNIAARHIAASRLDALIHNKIPQQHRPNYPLLLGECSLCVLPVAPNRPQTFGTASSFCEGSPGMVSHVNENNVVQWQLFLNIDFNDQDVKRKVLNLNLFDLVTGERDRNNANIIIRHRTSPTDRASDVFGIDNDFCFTHHTTQDGKTGWPEKFDRIFADAILAVTDDELANCMRGFRPLEINAAKTRLAAVKQFINAHAQDAVQPGQWNQVSPTSFAAPSHWASDPAVSYYGSLVEYPVKGRTEKKAKQQHQPSGKWVIPLTDATFINARAPDGSDLAVYNVVLGSRGQ
jgi:hypothetical protein